MLHEFRMERGREQAVKHLLHLHQFLTTLAHLQVEGVFVLKGTDCRLCRATRVDDHSVRIGIIDYFVSRQLA